MNDGTCTKKGLVVDGVDGGVVWRQKGVINKNFVRKKGRLLVQNVEAPSLVLIYQQVMFARFNQRCENKLKIIGTS